MPEEDLETGDLKESLDARLEEHEHAEHAAHGGGGGHAVHAKPTANWTRYLSLSTAVIAVFAAVASLKSGANSNEAILAKSEAMLHQAEASDQWALYQAKSIKGTLSEDVDSLWSAIQAAGIKPIAPSGDAAPAPAPAGEAAAAKPEGEGKAEGPAGKVAKLAKLGEESKRYREEAKEIQDKAEELERKVVEANKESDSLMKHHELFAVAVTLLQIAIALSAIAALTRLKPLWYVSMLVSAGGLVYFVNGWL